MLQNRFHKIEQFHLITSLTALKKSFASMVYIPLNSLLFSITLLMNYDKVLLFINLS